MVGRGGPDGADRAVVGQGMKRSRLVLAVILVAVAALVTSLWVNEGPLWRIVMLKRVAYEKEPVEIGILPFVSTEVRRIGWRTVKRWSDPPLLHGQSVLYYDNSGYRVKAEETEYRDGKEIGSTRWTMFGTVLSQRRIGEDRQRQQLTTRVFSIPNSSKVVEYKDSPPWWWGVEDQTEIKKP